MPATDCMQYCELSGNAAFERDKESITRDQAACQQQSLTAQAAGTEDPGEDSCRICNTQLSSYTSMVLPMQQAIGAVQTSKIGWQPAIVPMCGNMNLNGCRWAKDMVSAAVPWDTYCSHCY